MLNYLYRKMFFGCDYYDKRSAAGNKPDRVKIAVLLFLGLIFFTPCLAKNVPEVLKDTKPAVLSVADKILLKPVIVRMGASRMAVLVSRITGKVEYVWSNVYKCYVRPRFTMVNAQKLYEQFHN